VAAFAWLKVLPELVGEAQVETEILVLDLAPDSRTDTQVALVTRDRAIGVILRDVIVQFLAYAKIGTAIPFQAALLCLHDLRRLRAARRCRCCLAGTHRAR